MTPELGVIEGYFGQPWRHQDRKHVLTVLRQLGYSWYHYAPKADAFLRRRWREPHPDRALAELGELSAHCRAVGLQFGIGLSPYELYRIYDAQGKAAFAAKLRALAATGLDHLVILFDDTRGDVPNLAARECEIVHDALACTSVGQVFIGPTYYSDDRMLDVLFGPRPPGYVEELGRRLDRRVRVYWTGEEVCAREYGVSHLERVADALRRKPTLWDNYPVNDGPIMSRHLHLRGFTGRPSAIGSRIAGHAINPALQAYLTLIPAATLAASYREGAAYCYMDAFRRAAHSLVGATLADMLERDLPALQERGIDRLGDERAGLRHRYAQIDHPAAREVVRWLDGLDTVDGWVETIQPSVPAPLGIRTVPRRVP